MLDAKSSSSPRLATRSRNSVQVGRFLQRPRNTRRVSLALIACIQFAFFALSNSAAAQKQEKGQRGKHAVSSDSEPQQDGDASWVRLPFAVSQLWFNSSGTKVLAFQSGEKMTRMVIYDVDSLEEIGRSEYPGKISLVAGADPYLVFMETESSRITTVDYTLNVLGQRRLETPMRRELLIYDNVLQNGNQRFLVPTLEPLATGNLPSKIQQSSLGLVIDGFLMDESRRKPVWFTGNAFIHGSPPLSNSRTVRTNPGQPNANRPRPPRLSRRLAPMQICARLPESRDRPWELQLAAPYLSGFDPLRTADIDSHNSRSSWLRLQAVPPFAKSEMAIDLGLPAGRIRLSVPDDLDLPKPQGTYMVATRERCVAAYDQNLLVFRFIPERVANWSEQPKIKLDDAPILIPSGTVTSWPLKATSGREVNFVETQQAHLQWDPGIRGVRIDPTRALKGIRDEDLMNALIDQQQINLDATFEEVREKWNDPRWPVMRTLALAVGRRPKGFLWSLPVEFTAHCTDGSSPSLKGSVIVELDADRLKKPFEELQARRKASMEPPTLDPNRKLNIVYPKLDEDIPKVFLPPIPLIPRLTQLLIELFLSIVFLTLVVSLCLRITSVLFNRFGVEGRIDNLPIVRCLGVVVVACLISSSFDYLVVGLMNLGLAFQEKPDVATVVAVAVPIIIARIGIFIAALTVLGKIPFPRAIVMTFVVTILVSALTCILGIAVAFALAILVRTGIL